MRFCKFNAYSVPTTKTEKPKFTTKKKVMEETATKKPRTKKTEQIDPVENTITNG